MSPRPPLVAKFRCPTCGYETVSKVIATRGVRRRRICSECLDTFPTIEQVIPKRRAPRHLYRTKFPLLPFEESS